MGAAHTKLIEETLHEWPNATRSGFARAMRRLCDDLEGEDDSAEGEDDSGADGESLPPLEGSLLPSLPVPDAYEIDAKKHVVTCHECVVTHDIHDVLPQYLDLWWYLDDLGWSLRLFRRDLFGVVEVRLMRLAFDEAGKLATEEQG